ncbi:MAG: NAD(P)(+) transhydrogenase (Re/Si-specific) subunit alpha [Gemmatimonas sp.]|nr:NAD(P)(+) transhydrogenase (Re/Si-specific) subunit alpha [Gemmatimonas sp.]
MSIVALGKETAEGERRVALVPESVGRLTRAGVEVRVERGAGSGALISDQEYAKAGASVVDGGEALLDGADALIRVRRPTAEEASSLPAGIALIALLQPGSDEGMESILQERGVNALSLERVPRITRAQSMDVLSSQSTVAGYVAVLLGAGGLDKFLPMLTTAAGAIPPAKVFVIGAGVAGLQAIATAKRLGANVSGFDIRPAAAEQVKSLGASFVGPDALAADAETAGGYANEQSQDAQARTLEIVGTHIRDMDLVITTAQIPGRPAPRLITETMLGSMRPGSVIVDLAAETGGNCESTRAGSDLVVAGVTVMGPVDVPSRLPLHASQMFSRNVLTLLQHMLKDDGLVVDPEDEIVGPMLLTAPVGSTP